MRRLLFLSSTSLLAALGAGCGDDECGFGDAPDFGLVAGDVDTQLVFGNLQSGANNDCPDPAAPAGVISLTISGSQMGGTGLITLCVPRPDLLNNGVPLNSMGVRVIDLTGDANGCTFTLESTRPTTGTVSSNGLCDNGNNAAGYELIVDGSLSLRRTCTGSIDTLAVSLTGTVAVRVP